MADLQQDTELEGSNGRYAVTSSPSWEGFSGIPAGGYLAALALRAAGTEARLPLPVSIHCQFLKAPTSGERLDVAVEALRSTKRTAALRVSLAQSSQRVLEALVWTSAENLRGYDFVSSKPPVESRPEDWASIEGRTNQPLPACMQQIETRWNHEDPGVAGAHTEAYTHAWHRFRPKARYQEPYADACRLVLLADLRAFGPVAHHAGVPPALVPFFAPNMDLTVQFCRDSSDSSWLFGASRALAAARGTIASRIEFWSERGEPLAVASSTLMCRANPFAL
jgi:acyl-CoA thioesterase